MDTCDINIIQAKRIVQVLRTYYFEVGIKKPEKVKTQLAELKANLSYLEMQLREINDDSNKVVKRRMSRSAMPQMFNRKMSFNYSAGYTNPLFN